MSQLRASCYKTITDCSVSNKDTFPGSPHVQWEAADHVLRETLVLAAGRVESQEHENGCLSCNK